MRYPGAVKLAVVTLAALVAPGCESIFPLEFLDPVPHVPAEEEAISDGVVVVPAGETYTVTTGNPITPMGPNFVGIEFKQVRQDAFDEALPVPDIVIMRVRELTVDGTLKLQGPLPFVVIAERIVVNGTIDASATKAAPGAGGGTAEQAEPGEGGAGQGVGMNKNHSGGGGGGFAPGAGPGAAVDCGPLSLDGGLAGPKIGDEVLTVLRGGGAGGRGGFSCNMPTPGGGGGGAVQLTASETITIGGSGKILAGGGGGSGGLGDAECPLLDGAGSGGGAGGAIYIDADEIENRGLLAANGGGGGGGGGDGDDGAGSGGNGQTGRDATDTVMASEGGGGIQKKGTFGGNGSSAVSAASAGIRGTCSVVQPTINGGGGGGSFGRIVMRYGELIARGVSSPAANELARTAD